MVIELGVERADWMRSPGRTGRLRIGPFEFYVSTADGFSVSFFVVVAGLEGGWIFGSER